jgi:hypothetical protein
MFSPSTDALKRRRRRSFRDAARGGASLRKRTRGARGRSRRRRGGRRKRPSRCHLPFQFCACIYLVAGFLMGNFSGKFVNEIRKRRRRRTIEKEMKRCLPSSFPLPLFLLVASLLLFQSVARGGAKALKIEAECSACRAVAVS